MANLVYNAAKAQLADGTIDYLNDTIQVMLVTSSYTPDADDTYIDAGGANDPVDHELSGSGYTRKTLASKAINTDNTNDRAEFDAANLTWTAINAGTAAAAIVFHNAGTGDTGAQMICYIDQGGFPITTNGGDLTITWNAEGILQLA